jgi:hypothetical protein
MSKAVYFLFIVFLFAAVPQCRAGFFVHSHSAVNHGTAFTNSSSDVPFMKHRARPNQPINRYRFHREWRVRSYDNARRRGWLGIISLVSGIICFAIPIFAIAAVFVGMTNMGRGRRNKGLAIAGFTLGMIVALMVIFGSFSGVVIY